MMAADIFGSADSNAFQKVRLTEKCMPHVLKSPTPLPLVKKSEMHLPAVVQNYMYDPSSTFTSENNYIKLYFVLIKTHLSVISRLTKLKLCLLKLLGFFMLSPS